MFQELVPLLTTRALTITISREGESTERIRLNVVPIKYPGKDPGLGFSDQDKRRKEDFAKAAEGLNTPLTITGTPEEIDRELPIALTNYVAGLEGLRSNLEQVKKELEEAHQAAEQAKKAKPTVRPQPVKQEERKPEDKPAMQSSLDLFSQATELPATSATAAGPVVSTEIQTVEGEAA
jgi:PRTRC genetic system protein E